MKTFPMFLRMNDRSVVIAGGGEQAAQKCRLMLKTEAKITVLAEELDEELAALVQKGRIQWQQGAISPDNFRDTALVFVATGCPGMDAALHDLAKSAGALVNVVDQPDLCEAITPSIVDRDPVVVAIGTEGTAPVLARQIKTRMEQMLEPRLGDLAGLVGRLRASAAARLQPRQRRDLWRWVFSSSPRDTFVRGAEREAAEMIKSAIATATFDDPQSAAVSLVGAGPGCRDLITLRGVQRLQEADIIFYDRLVDPGLLELARRDAERVFVGKAPGCHSWPQDRINDMLVRAAQRGQRVVRLKCGDPGVFARGAEEAAALNAAGVSYEIVPGVTAASAAAATTGGFLTERGRTDCLVLATAASADGNLAPDWTRHLIPGTRLALYMGVGAAAEIQQTLIDKGIADAVNVQIISRAETPDQTVFQCRGDELLATTQLETCANPAIIFLEHSKVQSSAVARPVRNLRA